MIWMFLSTQKNITYEMKYILILILFILLTTCLTTKPTIKTNINIHKKYKKYTSITYSVKNVPHFNDTTILQLLEITDERKIDSVFNDQIDIILNKIGKDVSVKIVINENEKY